MTSDPFSIHAVRGAYDTVARDYTARFGDDLAVLPVDRAFLDDALAVAGTDGWTVDLGCGPAPSAGYLAGRVPHLLGVDLSPAMLAEAGARIPSLARLQADLRALPVADGACALVVASYSLQHVPRSDLGGALRELRRVIRPEGWLLVATHLGEGDVHIDEFLGHPIATLGGAFYRRDELLDLLGAAGFRVREERQREPLPHEVASRRIYLLAQRTN